LGQKVAKLSDLTFRSLDRQTRFTFGRWVLPFRRRVGARELTSAWNALEEAGCLFDDLEWALYWAIDHIDTARSEYVGTTGPARFRAFHADAVDVLREIRSLRPALYKLMEAKLCAEPFWYQFFGLLDLPKEQAFQFWKFQYELALWGDLGYALGRWDLVESDAESVVRFPIPRNGFIAQRAGCHFETRFVMYCARWKWSSYRRVPGSLRRGRSLFRQWVVLMNSEADCWPVYPAGACVEYSYFTQEANRKGEGVKATAHQGCG